MLADRRRLGDALGDDVAGAGKGFLAFALRMVEFHVPELEGQGLIAFFTGHGSPRTAFGPVREIEVFHGLGIDLIFNGPAQVIRQLALFLDAGEDGRLALLQFREAEPVVPDGRHLHLVQGAGALLAVAADEGNGRPFLEEFDAMFYLPGSHFELTGNMVRVQFIHWIRL